MKYGFVQHLLVKKILELVFKNICIMPCCMLYFDISDTSVVNENRDLDDLLNISTLLTGRSAAKNRLSHCMA